MQNHKTHQINEKGKGLLRGLLPSTWVKNEIGIDYGKDFLIEPAYVDGNLTGDAFFVQLKSTESPKYARDRTTIKHELSSKHARYFTTIRDFPLFLVIMDVLKGVGYFLFLQKTLAENQSWLHKKQITISVPTSSLLTDAKILAASIADAQEWLRARHPSSIANAINAETLRIRELDPRFEIETHYVSGSTRHKLITKQNVQVAISFAPAAAKKLEEFIHFGKTVDFEPGEIQIAGSELFAIAEKEGCSLSKDGIAARMRIHTLIDEQRAHSTSEFDCRLSGGSKLSVIKTIVPNCPLEIALEIQEIETSEEQTSSVGIQMRFKADNWESKPVSVLAYFKEMVRLFTALNDADSVEFEVCSQGETLALIPCENAFREKAEFTAQLLEDIARTKRLGELLKVDPIWSMGEFCKHYTQFCVLEKLANQGSWKGPSFIKQISLSTVDKKDLNKIESQYRSERGPIGFECVLKLNLLGVVFDFGQVKSELTNMELARRSKTSKQLEFRATPKSELTLYWPRAANNSID